MPGQSVALTRRIPLASRFLGNRDELVMVRQAYSALVVVAAFLQVVFFSGEPENLATTLVATISSLLGIHFALDGKRFRALPISACMLLLYTTTSTAGALLIKTMEWSAVADKLTVPLETFSVLFMTQIALIVADRIYQKAIPLQRFRQALTRRVLMPLGALRWPPDSHLWLLGLIGCVSLMASGADFQGEVTRGMASAGGRILAAITFLKYAPFLIPFRNALGGVPQPQRAPLLLLGIYFCMQVGMSFATNSRSTFADAIPTIGMCVLCAQAFGRIDFKRISPSKIIVFAVIAGLGALVLSRIALAMVVARDYRAGSDTATLVGTTIEAFFNSDWLQAAKAKMDASTPIGNYSEEYLNNRFFARFLLTKFHDNMLYYFSLMGPDQIVSYKAFLIDRLIAFLPEPAINALGFSIDKQNLIFSNGDFVVYLVDGWGLGGFKSGSLVSEVFGIFGWWSPLVIIACGIALFVMYDAFAMPTALGRVAMSPMILLLIWNLCGTTAAFGMGSETIMSIIGGILRNLPQTVLMYVLVLWGVRQVSRLWGGSS